MMSSASPVSPRSAANAPTPRHWLQQVMVASGRTGGPDLTLDRVALVDAWSIVARSYGLSDDDLAEIVAESFYCEVAPPSTPNGTMLRSALPEDVAYASLAAPIALRDRELVVAVADPRDPGLAARLAKVARRPVAIAVAPPETVQNWILVVYAQTSTSGRVLYQPGTDGWERSQDEASDATAQITAEMFAEAVLLGASDIHVQPFLGGGVVRYRVDGILRRGPSLPAAVLRRIISRVKAVAQMDVTDHLRPCDGRAQLQTPEKSIDLRISTLPVEGGEKMVVRLLGSGRVPSFSDLRFTEPQGSRVRELLTRRQGIVFVTGPTGSGKTTTLHACMALLNQVQTSIVTVEDPVEFRIPGLAQVDVQEAQGMTFASALRAVLRQDPNVIMVGEIRDAETAGVALTAALTGHPVVTTVHTTRAIGVIARLLELGVARTVLADGFGGATAQRLLRSLCADCALTEVVAPTASELRLTTLTGIRSYRAVGCASCGYSGYRGRLPIAQVLMTSSRFREGILDAQATEADLEAIATDEGMLTLGRAAAVLIEAGRTTVDEAVRVLGASFWMDVGDVPGRFVST
jgi:type II secretory ATPase GspE/PulE/Tfp pilus assembly ATPase PilB-like protein